MAQLKTSLVILFTLFIISLDTEGQKSSSLSGKIGLSLQFGSHIQRIGFMYQLYYFNNFIQISQGGHYHFNFKNLGPKEKGNELITQLGIMLYWGKTDYNKKYVFNENSLLSDKENAIGYIYKYYFDQVQTSQATGTISYYTKHFLFTFENDLFGGKIYDDKFRTAALSLSYQIDSLLISIQSTNWTGKSIDAPRIKDQSYPAKYGYNNLSNVPYGKLSHGILAIRMEYSGNYSQVYRLETGIDAEQIRHALQNKFTHDFLLPAKLINYENLHYPMLQSDGSPYLFKEGQKIRPAKWYGQTGLNQLTFY